MADRNDNEAQKQPTIEKVKPGPVKADLVIQLYADGVLVAELRDVAIWVGVLKHAGERR
jgi:hypothetical protein